MGQFLNISNQRREEFVTPVLRGVITVSVYFHIVRNKLVMS